jgi:hypothetical protein
MWWLRPWRHALLPLLPLLRCRRQAHPEHLFRRPDLPSNKTERFEMRLRHSEQSVKYLLNAVNALVKAEKGAAAGRGKQPLLLMHPAVDAAAVVAAPATASRTAIEPVCARGPDVQSARSSTGHTEAGYLRTAAGIELSEKLKHIFVDTADVVEKLEQRRQEMVVSMPLMPCACCVASRMRVRTCALTLLTLASPAVGSSALNHRGGPGDSRPRHYSTMLGVWRASVVRTSSSSSCGAHRCVSMRVQALAADFKSALGDLSKKKEPYDSTYGVRGAGGGVGWGGVGWGGVGWGGVGWGGVGWGGVGWGGVGWGGVLCCGQPTIAVGRRCCSEL